MELKKKSIEDLAIFGGQAEFEDKLHVGRPNIGDRELFLDRVNDILDRKSTDIRETARITIRAFLGL